MNLDLFSQAPIVHFDGATYEAKHDHARLTKQLLKVKEVMDDGQWHTLRDIAERAECPEQSASARLRDLRKAKFGGYVVERHRIDGGLWAYRLTNP